MVDINLELAEAISGEDLSDWQVGDDIISKETEETGKFCIFSEAGKAWVNIGIGNLRFIEEWSISECCNISSALRGEMFDISTLWDDFDEESK